MLLYTTSFFGYVASLGTRGGVQVDISAHGIFKEEAALAPTTPVAPAIKLEDLPFQEWFALNHNHVDDEAKKGVWDGDVKKGEWDGVWYENQKKRWVMSKKTISIDNTQFLTEIIETLLVFNRIDLIKALVEKSALIVEPIILKKLKTEKYKKKGEDFSYDIADENGLLVAGEGISRADDTRKQDLEGNYANAKLAYTTPKKTPISELVTELESGIVGMDDASKAKVIHASPGEAFTGFIHYEKREDLERKIFLYPANAGMNEKPGDYHAYPYIMHEAGTGCDELFVMNGKKYNIGVVHMKQNLNCDLQLVEYEQHLKIQTSHELCGCMALKKTTMEGSDRTGFLGFTFVKGGVLKIKDEEFIIPHRISGTSRTFNSTNVADAAGNYFIKLGNNIVKALYMQFFTLLEAV